MRKESFLLCLFVTTILSTTGCQKVQDLPDAVSFTNPLLPTGPDPWVIQKDSFYYYTSTEVSSITIRKTKSVSRLKDATQTLVWTPKKDAPNSVNIWAPELHFLNDKWYLYYTAGSSATNGYTQRIFVLENSGADPTKGTWKDMGKIADPAEDFFAIDATVFEIDTVKYMVWSSVAIQYSDKQSIFIARLKDPWTLDSKRVMISAPQYEWEKIGLPVTSGINEGPEILKNAKGETFLTYSASGCWTDSYGLGMLSLKKDSDPLIASNWIKYQAPVLSTDALSNAFGPGHNTFFKSPDGKEDWIMYHANPGANEQCLGQRSPRMQKFTWSNDGAPVFGQPVPINKKILRPSGEK